MNRREFLTKAGQAVALAAIAGDQPSGMYFCRIQAGDYTDVKKTLLLK